MALTSSRYNMIGYEQVVGSCEHVIFLIGTVGGGVQLCPFGTAATNRPIVPAPGNYVDGEIGGKIGRGNRSTRRNLPQFRFVRHKPHMLPGRESGPPLWEASD
jgi:hypothetical protein